MMPSLVLLALLGGSAVSVLGWEGLACAGVSEPAPPAAKPAVRETTLGTRQALVLFVRFHGEQTSTLP